MNIFEILFVQPITNVLVAFYQLLAVLHVPYALGFSIIALTIFIRVILSPFVSAQIKAASKMQKLAPHMAAVKEKHKEDKKKQQEELLRLYKEHGINPASGCLPILIQIPVIWSLYGVLNNIVAVNSVATLSKVNNLLYFPFLRIQHVWDTSFFGLSLSLTPAKLMPSNPFIIMVPILTGVLQLVFSAMMMPHEEKKNPPALRSEHSGSKTDGQGKKKESKDDFQKAFQTQSLFIFPIMIGFFSHTFPVGLSLYWNTFTVFGILQQYFLVGPGRLAVVIQSFEQRLWKKKK